VLPARSRNAAAVIDTGKTGKIIFAGIIPLPGNFRPTRNGAGWNAMTRGIEF
jgi:hypothetical protein